MMETRYSLALHTTGLTQRKRVPNLRQSTVGLRTPSLLRPC